MIFPFRHNWASPYLERLAWLTDISTSWGGAESRTALRVAPRRVLEYTVTAPTAAAAAGLEAALWAGGASILDVPDWGHQSRLREAASAGATSLLCETSGRAFVSGGEVLISTRWDQAEAVEVLSVGPGGLTLADPTTKAWPAGARVAPLIRAQLLDEHESGRISAAVSSQPITFEQYDPPELDPGEAPATYRGVEVLTRRPDRIEPLRFTYARAVDRIEALPGIVVRSDRTGRPRIAVSLSFVLPTREAYGEHLAFLARRAGRRHAVWVPTFSQDLQPVAGMLAEDESITVRDLGTRTAYGLAAGRKDLQILVRGQPPIYRRVVSAEAGTAGVEVLHLDAPIGVDAAPGDIRAVSWLALCRLDSDTIENVRYSAGVARSVVPVVTLDEDETADYDSA